MRKLFLINLFSKLFITLFKVDIHQLALTLIKIKYSNKNTNNNQVNFLVALLLTSGSLNVSYSQYVEL